MPSVPVLLDTVGLACVGWDWLACALLTSSVPTAFWCKIWIANPSSNSTRVKYPPPLSSLWVDTLVTLSNHSGAICNSLDSGFCLKVVLKL